MWCTMYLKSGGLSPPLLPSTVVSDAKKDLAITSFLNLSSNTDIIIRKQHIHVHVAA